MRDTFIRALKNKAAVDQKIFLMVGDLGYGVVDGFASELPMQFLNAGIAEQNMVGMAAGLASRGRLPFVYSIANFPTMRCFEQIRNDVCYHNLPVTIVSIGAGMGYGTLGYSHFAIEDLAIMRSLPGIRVLSPADPSEVEACLDLILKKPMPTYLRLGKNGEKQLHSNEVAVDKFPIEICEGFEIVVLSTGAITELGINAVRIASSKLDKQIGLYSVPIVKPLDLGNLALSNCKMIITLEEHTLSGGFGSAVLEYMSDRHYQAPIVRIGLEDQLRTDIGSQDYLRSITKLDSEAIAQKMIGAIRGLT